MKITQLLDRPIAYHRVFVTLTGSVKAAIMLSQAVYWQPRAKQADGWWYKTAEEWTEETGLSEYEQRSARKAAEKYLFSDLRGIPATLFYKVNEEALAADLLQTSSGETAELVGEKLGNINKNTETTTETNGVPPNYGYDWQIGAGVEHIQPVDDKLNQMKDAANLIATGTGIRSSEVYELVMAFQVARQKVFTGSDIKGQRKAAKSLLEKGIRPEHVTAAIAKLIEDGMTVTDLYSVQKTADNIANPPPETSGMNPQGLEIKI